MLSAVYVVCPALTLTRAFEFCTSFEFSCVQCVLSIAENSSNLKKEKNGKKENRQSHPRDD